MRCRRRCSRYVGVLIANPEVLAPGSISETLPGVQQTPHCGPVYSFLIKLICQISVVYIKEI